MWDSLIERFDAILPTTDFNIISDSNLWAMANIYYERGKVQLITKILTDKLNEDSGNALKIIKIFPPPYLAVHMTILHIREIFRRETMKNSVSLLT